MIPALLTSVEWVFACYRDWHRAQCNAAFNPWHTAALCLYLRHRDDPDMVDFVFEMTDGLLPIQQTHNRPADVLGEFFTPSRPDFGLLYASATGVYPAGMIKAWALAQRLGDPRETAHRHAIQLTLRPLRQLQFHHPSDMYCITCRDRVQGGLRTTTYDNRQRLDNVQHGLMAIHRLLSESSDPRQRNGGSDHQQRHDDRRPRSGRRQ